MLGRFRWHLLSHSTPTCETSRTPAETVSGGTGDARARSTANDVNGRSRSLPPAVCAQPYTVKFCPVSIGSSWIAFPHAHPQLSERDSIIKCYCCLGFFFFFFIALNSRPPKSIQLHNKYHFIVSPPPPPPPPHAHPDISGRGAILLLMSTLP